ERVAGGGTREITLAVVTMKQLLESGVHFGHQARRWNPKMKRFIFMERNGIHIIDLQQTLTRVEEAYTFMRDLAADGGQILFVGTKKQAQESIAEEAKRAGMHYVNQRWLGGFLTNFVTIQKRIQRLNDLMERKERGDFATMPKKDAQRLDDELTHLDRYFSGVRELRRPPTAIFVVDLHREHIEVAEARRLACTSRKRTRSTPSAGSGTRSRRKRPRPPWRRKRTSDGEHKGRRQAPPRGDRRWRDGLQASARRSQGRLRESEGPDQGARPG